MIRLSGMIFVLLFIPSVVWGQFCKDNSCIALTPAILGGAGGGAAAAAFTCSGDAFLLCDNFDGGSVTCADDNASQANCWVAWAALASANISNQATGLDGTYGKSITISGGASLATYTTFTAGSPRYVFARYKPTSLTLTDTTTKYFLALTSASGGTGLAGLNIINDGGVFKWTLSCGATMSAVVTDPAPAQGTEYYVWVDFTKGATATCNAYIATTSTKPGSPTITQTGAGNYDAGRIYFNAWGSGVSGNMRGTYDRVRVGATDPGAGN